MMMKMMMMARCLSASFLAMMSIITALLFFAATPAVRGFGVIVAPSGLHAVHSSVRSFSA
jgi:hypothetical protein